MGHSQILSRVLRTVSACMINLRHIYNVANLIQFINIDTPYAQYRMLSAILRNHLKPSVPARAASTGQWALTVTLSLKDF